VPVKRVQSFEYYGADALPKPARKGGRAEGTARTLGRRVSERVFFLNLVLSRRSREIKFAISTAEP
jgi:hypothetical protein